MAKQLIWILGVFVVLTGCVDHSNEPLVARWNSGSLSLSELDDHIVNTPPVDRVVDTSDPVSWWKDHAEEVILHKILLDAADLETDAIFISALRDERRRLVADAKILKRRGPIAEPSAEELQHAWTKLEKVFNTPESRQLYNIFRRAESKENQAAAIKEMRKVRQRILSGESFQDIAETSSDSESRHRRGFVGTFQPGQLDPRLDAIVFSLEQESPSEPVVSGDGVHLFFVRSVSPKQSMTFEESRSELISHLQIETRWNRLNETAQELWTPLESDIIFEAEDVPKALRQEGDETILRVGDFAMSKSRWFRWANSNLDERKNAADYVLGYLTLVRNEMILQGVEATTGIDTETTKALSEIELRLRAERQLEIELQESVGDEELASYFSANSRRFATARKSHFRRLEVSLDDSPVALMSHLEKGCEALERGEMNLDKLALKLGGTIDDLGWLTGPQLARVLPNASPSVLGLESGKYGHPFSTGRSLVLLEVVATEAQSVPVLDEVRPQVLAQYIKAERPRLLKRVKESLLSNAGVEFEEMWLDSLSRPGELSPTS